MQIHVQDPPFDVPCEPQTTILEALKTAGYTMFTGCKRGGCGVCRVKLLKGQVHMNPYSRYALNDEQWDAGAVLACRAEPQGDISIQMDGANRLARTGKEAWLQASYPSARKQ